MGIEQKLGDMGVATLKLEQAVNWARTNAMWPMLFGLACCAIEMICTASSRFDAVSSGPKMRKLAGFARTIEWSGVHYRLLSDQAVEIVARESR